MPTTVGRVLLYEIVPKQLPFKIVNRVMGKKQLGDLIDSCYRACGQKETVLLADKLRSLGYTYATKAGISICVDDLQIPARKIELLETAQKDVQEIEEQYTEGLITDGERYNKVVDIWAQVSEQIAEEMMSEIGTEELDQRRDRREAAQPVVQPDLHHGRLGRAWLGAADSSAGRHARPHGEAVGRDHRDPHHHELP